MKQPACFAQERRARGPMSPSIYAVILAGGSGERFWPLSRRTLPKQLLPLVDGRSLLEATIDRLDGLVPPERILVLTNAEIEWAVRGLCPSIPPRNVLVEPAKRDTAAAVALAAGWVCKQDPAATMCILSADHLIRNADAFRTDLRNAAEAAASGALVTFGIRPTWACPGYGYIETGDEIAAGDGRTTFHQALRFREKPNAELAESFLREGCFLWNAGIFVWSVHSIISEFNRHFPELAAFIARVHETPELDALLGAEFATLPRISIDYAIMEKAHEVWVAAAGFDWDDLGGWPSLARYLAADEHGNACNGPMTVQESSGNMVHAPANTHVALLGVNDLIVVQSGDALLICNRHEAERIKDIVKRLPPELQ